MATTLLLQYLQSCDFERIQGLESGGRKRVQATEVAHRVGEHDSFTDDPGFRELEPELVEGVGQANKLSDMPMGSIPQMRLLLSCMMECGESESQVGKALARPVL